jgi:hypothetical protein
MIISTNIWSSFFPRSLTLAPERGLLSACCQQRNAANERHCACDGRQRYIMCLVASSVNRSDVDNRFPGRVRKASPRKTEQAKRNQYDPKCFARDGRLL